MAKFVTKPTNTQYDELQQRLGRSNTILIENEPTSTLSFPTNVTLIDDESTDPLIAKTGTKVQFQSPPLRIDIPSPPLPVSVPKTVKVSDDDKLGTFEGVYIQVISGIWGVILFLRLGYILSQVGLLVTLGMFLAGYTITTFTSLSISAISTNGTVKGGGPYYMISRSLGPEFGGSIGTVVYLGTALNGVLNGLAAVEGVIEFFGKDSGTIYKILPESELYLYCYGTIILMFGLMMCSLGSTTVAKTSVVFVCLLFISTLSILATFLFQTPFHDPVRNITFTGLSLTTLKGNLYPNLGYNDSGIMETFQSIFGVLFPACIGIMAGASMSGNLKNPSQSIPKGTLGAVATTFVMYIGLTILFAATVPHSTLRGDLNIMTHIGLYPPLVNIGVLSTSIASILGCFIGASKILQAMARDDLLPVFSLFKYGTSRGDEPIPALLLTYILAQVCLGLGDINAVAGIVTMFFVLTFGVTNLACFSLKVGSAPNFRPSFRYFHAWTALVGVIICFGTMFYVDATSALLSTTFAIVVFITVHYLSPPKSWGDVTQSLIYHQVRKYLLRLDLRKDHVKFWRPQILLLVSDPRSHYPLIQLCNALKKGSLYLIGHVIKGELRQVLPELRKQRSLWLKLVDTCKVKSFVQLTVGLDDRSAVRSMLLNSGLGGMIPNIVMVGEFNLDHHNRHSNRTSQMNLDELINAYENPLSQPKVGYMLGPLPTDEIRTEKPISIHDYVGIIEDSLMLNKAVAIAFKFTTTPLLPCLPKELLNQADPTKTFIDLWPIQMAIKSESGTITTNFDSYTMVLQLGCILHTVPNWKSKFQLRVNCFVEHQADVVLERSRVQNLLDNLRVPAQLNVFYLDSGAVQIYEELLGNLRGRPSAPSNININFNNQEQENPLTPKMSTSLRINLPLPEDTYAESDQNSVREEHFLDDNIHLAQSPTSLTSPVNVDFPNDFNELDAEHQYAILNQLIKQQSSNTAVIISTLPAPDLGTCEDEMACLSYINSLNVLVADLPPTVLVHSKSITVTTQL